MMDVTIGQPVHYKLSQEDVQQYEQLRAIFTEQFDLPQTMIGEDVRAGEVFPAIVIKAQGPQKASLRVVLPGIATLYAQSKVQGGSEGQWIYPELSEEGPLKEHLDTVTQARGQKVGSR